MSFWKDFWTSPAQKAEQEAAAANKIKMEQQIDKIIPILKKYLVPRKEYDGKSATEIATEILEAIK